MERGFIFPACFPAFSGCLSCVVKEQEGTDPVCSPLQPLFGKSLPVWEQLEFSILTLQSCFWKRKAGDKLPCAEQPLLEENVM